RQIKELSVWIRPSQDGSARFARQPIKRCAPPVFPDRREQIEQWYWLRFACNCDAAVGQTRKSGAADRRDFDDGVAPITVSPTGRNHEGAKDRGSRAARVQPADRTPRQALIGRAAGQDGDIGSVMLVVAAGPRVKSAHFDAAPAIIRDSK